MIGWGRVRGGGVRGQAPPNLMGSLYRNTEEVSTRIYYAPSPKTHSFSARLLLRRIVSLRVFSKGAKFHCAPSPKAPRVSKRLLLWRSIFDDVAIKNIPSSPKALSFIARLLLWRLVSFRSVSYGA